MPVKYVKPDFIPGSQRGYSRWLSRKTAAHVRRDRSRGNCNAAGAAYKKAIHRAVIESCGLDAYTGEPLDWHLLSTYDNELSKQGRVGYKQSFARLPTVDHVGGYARPVFKICGWAVNDAKGDLTREQFLELCKRVLAHCAEQ